MIHVLGIPIHDFLVGSVTKMISLEHLIRLGRVYKSRLYIIIIKESQYYVQVYAITLENQAFPGDLNGK